MVIMNPETEGLEAVQRQEFEAWADANIPEQNRGDL
jgi:hypothetical protein